MNRFILLVLATASACAQPIGAPSNVGAPKNAKIIHRLEITKPGVYENFILDGQGAGGNLVKITADNVTIRNAEITNGKGNAIGIFGNRVVIENVRIHHMLNGTYEDQNDAHGISGRWGDNTIRNCDISYCSGDCIQFDPDRKSSGTVVIENCTLWTGPLPADASTFKTSQRPGENAFDSKTKPDGPRCVLKMTNCFMHGFNQPSQIRNCAALNLKENVDAEITHCVLDDCEIAIRARGPGKRGGAHVIVNECAVFNTTLAVRAEDKIDVLKLNSLAFGKGVKERIRFVDGKATSGFESKGERDAPDMTELLRKGF